MRFRLFKLLAFVVVIYILPTTLVANNSQTNLNDKLLKLEQTFNQKNFKDTPNVIELIADIVTTEPDIALQYIYLLRSHNYDHPVILDYYEMIATFHRSNYQGVIRLANKLFNSNISDAWLRKTHVYAIKSYYYLHRYQDAITHFERLKTSFRYSVDHENLLRLVADSYLKIKDHKKYYVTVEAIASLYPYSHDARWAFATLLQNDCDDSSSSQNYKFSFNLLKKLSWSASEFNDLKGFILAKLNESIVYEGNIQKLDALAKANALFQMRFYDEAKSFIQTELAIDRQELHTVDTLAKFSELLGQIQIRQGLSSEAVATFSNVIKKYPTFRPVQMRLWLADALRYDNLPAAAATIYQKAYSVVGGEYAAWNSFWAAYRAEDYEMALNFLDTKNFRSRDGETEATALYWTSKIQEKLGNYKEAESYRNQLLNKYGQSIYATLAVFKNPLIKRNQLEAAQSLELPAQANRALDMQILLALNDNSELLNLSQKENIIDDTIPKLIQKDLMNPALTMLNKRLASNFKSKEEIMLLQKLLQQAKIYTPRMDWMRKLDVHNNQLPQDFTSYLAHIRANQESWQLFYPKAYENILAKFSNNHFVNLMTYSIMRAESFYRESARSTVGATGLMQIMPQTGFRISKEIVDPEFDSQDLINPEKNLNYANFYIQKLLTYFDQNYFVALAAYNAGPEFVKTWLRACDSCEVDEFIESIPFRETRRYVKKVVQNIQLYSYIYDNTWNFDTWPTISKTFPAEIKSIY